ncbi:hypothetical protein [Oleiphilus sp. HI0125]|nr:hypothetical protein [Oleiphilus sp. HI0125]
MTTAYKVMVDGHPIDVIDTANKDRAEFNQSMKDRFGDRYQGLYIKAEVK